MIGVLDIETDPFAFGRVPRPFLAGYALESGESWHHWGPDCMARLAEQIAKMRGIKLYAHNGGKFDFHYLLPFVKLESEVMIINGRIGKMRIGKTTLVDSYLLLPFALAAYKKDEVDYRKFEVDAREKHREEITRYWRNDCLYLLELLQGVIARVGDHLTIGGAAVKGAQAMGIPISRHGQQHDDAFRPYYYGGRVEALRPGVHRRPRGAPSYYLDINSAYPWSMRHPHPFMPAGGRYSFSTTLPVRRELGPQFVALRGVSHGALPVREGPSLSFPRDLQTRAYYVTGHEVAAGLDTGTLDIEEILAVWTPPALLDYQKYVDHHFGARKIAKQKNDTVGDITHKLMANSLYGKFATDPEKHKVYRWAEYGVDLAASEKFAEYELSSDFGECGVSLWEAPSPRRAWSYYDVAIAASITGQVRAKLWRALCAVDGAYYCDTDSIMCDGPGELKIGDKLGDWKIEARPDRLYIAAKKIYAVRDKLGGKWKSATKGFRATPEEIKKIAEGGTISWRSDAPAISLDGVSFVEREINTAKRKKRARKGKVGKKRIYGITTNGS